MQTVTIEVDSAKPCEEQLDIPWDRVADLVVNTVTSPEMIDLATPNVGGGNSTVPPSLAPFVAAGKVTGKRIKARIYIEEEEDQDEK